MAKKAYRMVTRAYGGVMDVYPAGIAERIPFLFAAVSYSLGRAIPDGFGGNSGE
jgi:hypothetical protein